MTCYLIQHDLNSLTELPNFIWNTEKAVDDIPPNYEKVRPGDRWVAHAYKVSYDDERSLDLITGFYECVSTYRFGEPPKPIESVQKAWFIEGKPYGDQPNEPVKMGSLKAIIGGQHYWGQAIIPICDDEFDKLREAVL